MNERIRELADQAELTIRTSTGTYMSHPEFNKKFAELIIRDCMDVVDGYTKGRTFDTHYDAVVQIETLFGIKHNGDDE
jgi:hypothetical protein